MRYRLLTAMITVAAAGMFTAYHGLTAQGVNQPSADAAENPKEPLVIRKKDPLRTCGERKLAIPEKEPPPANQSQERKEEAELIAKVKQREQAEFRELILDIQSLHKELEKLYPHIKDYQEIFLEDAAGTYINNRLSSHQKVVSFTFNQAGEVSCIVFDVMTREVHYPDYFSRRIIRFYYPDLDNPEVETFRHNYRNVSNIASLGILEQGEFSRQITKELNLAKLKFSLLVAYYQEQNRRITQWKIRVD